MITISDKNYAKALVQTGHEDSAKNIEIIQEILAKSPDLREFLVNPAVSEDIKYSVIVEVFSNDVTPKMIEFLKILVNKKRFGQFDSIAEAFNKELDDINNIKRVEIISAVDLDVQTKEDITQKLHNKLQKEIVPAWSKDESILAGLVFRIEDDVIDASLRARLEALNKHLKG